MGLDVMADGGAIWSERKVTICVLGGGKRGLMRLRHFTERWSYVCMLLYDIGVRYHGIRTSIWRFTTPQSSACRLSLRRPLRHPACVIQRASLHS